MSTFAPKPRMLSIDLIRVVSAFYIIGFWHLMNYVDGYSGYFNPYTARATVITLSLFTFASGFFLGRKPLSLTAADFSSFYRKRLLRIYPPFVVAMVCFFILRIVDLSTFIKSVLLVATVWGPSPPTLWYICMISAFYIIAPILIHFREKWLTFFLSSAAIYCLFLAIWMLAGTLDTRMLVYFPSFAAGVFFAGQTEKFNPLFIVLTGALTLAAAIIGWDTPTEIVETSIKSTPLAIFAALFITSMATRCDAYLSGNWIAQLSYATLFMYLFHRVVYRPAMYLFPSQDPNTRLLFALFVCFPIIVALSWIGQKIYDRLLVRFNLTG